MRRQHEPIAQDPQPDLSARFEGLSLPELITRAVLEFPDGVGIIDSRGRIQFTNSSLERMLGYERGELIGVPISRLHPSGTDSVVLRQTTEILPTEGWSEERDLLTRQGTVVPTLETVKPLSNEAGELVGYVCTVRDIRKRRARERALQESEERYRAVVDNVNDAIVVNVGELRAFVNPAYLDLIGLEDDSEVIGARIDKFIVPEDREGVTRRSLARQRGDEMEAVYEYRIQRADGEIRTVQTSAVATTFEGQPASLAILRDVTALREVEQEVRTRSEELQALFNVASVLSSPGTLAEQVTRALEEVERIAEVDAAHLRVADEKEEGLHLVAAVGRGVNALPRDTERPLDSTRSGRVFKDGEPIVENDNTKRRGRAFAAYGSQSGAWLPVKAAGRTIGVLTVNSTELGYFTPRCVRVLTAIASGIGTFVESAKLRETERLHVEELETTLDQLRTTQQQLIQAEKLAAVGTLISGVAHEINNPLGNILGRVQLLQRAAGDDESKRDLQTVRDECERAIRIVRNLLSFTREHMPETTLVSLNDVIDQVLELRAYELKVSNIELKKNFGADLPQIHADPHQLQQVFLNLVINAEQAMTAAHGRGSLSITTKRVGDTLQVVVADDGPGIPDELISQIFNPFFTTKDVGAGTGLGLSVCYGIVKEHGGQMRVESEQQKGTTFTVELPCRCKADGGGRPRLDHAQQIREKWE